MKNKDSVDLIASDFRRGEHTAFKKVYDLLFPQLHYFTIKLINDREEAEDIVIQAFEKLFKRHYDFDSFPNLRAYLYISARNACFNYLKFKQRNLARANELASEMESEETIEKAIIEAEVLQSIYAAVERLPTECKKVFKLIYYENLEHAIIAERLNISVFTVRNHRKRAIQLLRQMLSQKQHWVLGYLLIGSLLQNQYHYPVHP